MFRFDNSYRQLPSHFYAPVNPTPVERPDWLAFNRLLAADLGLRDDLEHNAQALEVFSGNQLPEGAEPIAMAYAGHQFGHPVPQLGDGRAVLLGEHIDPEQQRHDIQLKGSGRTPFSRNGDGRAAIGPVLREYLLSEAMHALGIPTTRALAAVRSGEPVLRERPMPGAVLTRVASSHLRVGSFQYFAFRGDREAVAQLLDHAIARHYPQLTESDTPALDFISQVGERQARLVAGWMSLGFIHGVMNTDNSSICGETIDYGPCAFMNQFDPATVYSSIDRRGRYAWQNQPAIAQWNLARLAECLLPLIDADEQRAIDQASSAVEAFGQRYQQHWQRILGDKLGLGESQPGDSELIDQLLAAMQQDSADYSLSLRHLAETADQTDAQPFDSPALKQWHAQWRARIQTSTGVSSQALCQKNPLFIPRNHHVDRALTSAEQGDLQPFRDLLTCCLDPYRPHPELKHLSEPPKPGEDIAATFCGT